MSDEGKHERAVEAAMELYDKTGGSITGPVKGMSEDETLMVLARGLQGLGPDDWIEMEVTLDEEEAKELKSDIAKAAKECENFFEQTKDEARTNELTEKHKAMVS